MRRVALLAICACGPVTGVAADTDTSSSTQASLTDAVSVTANSTVPPQDVSTLEAGSYDAVSFEEGPFDDGVKLDMFATGGPTCPQVFDAYPAASAVAVLIDASQTMVTQLVDHDGDAGTPEITRWAMATIALPEPLAEMYQHSLISIAAFPAFAAAAPPDVGACTVDASHPALGSSVEQIVQYLPPIDATFMQGATPTSAALASAYAEIDAIDGIGRGHIVVVTDGAPNCNGDLAPPDSFDQFDAHSLEWAATAFASGMLVHVIGIDVPSGTAGGGPEGDAITDHRAALTQLAQSGGTDAVFVEDATVLDLALAAIADEARSCRLLVPPALVGQWYDVVIDDIYFYDLGVPENCAANSGYYRVQLDGGEAVELCGLACEALHVYGGAVIEQQCVIPE